MSETIQGVVVSCPKCLSGGVNNVGRYVWSSNQYGAKVRIFCHVCGAVSEKSNYGGVLKIECLNWTVPTRTSPEKNPPPIQIDLDRW